MKQNQRVHNKPSVVSKFPNHASIQKIMGLARGKEKLGLDNRPNLLIVWTRVDWICCLY